MAIARFKDLCLDAGDPARLGAFWASVLGRTWEAKDDGDGLLTGPAPQHTIWVNRVPEAKAVKHRVHLDVYARDLADLRALGATVVEPAARHAHLDDHGRPRGRGVLRVQRVTGGAGKPPTAVS
jgi:hypothetical protein